MNRYVSYHYFINTFSNIMLLVPYHLTVARFDGAVLAILLSPVIGGILLYMFTSGMQVFPEKGFPEIFSLFYPKWLVRILMTFKALMIGTSTAIVVTSYAVIITRFLNPEGNQYAIMAVLMLVCAFGATRSTVTVNFILEIILILNIPLIGFIIYKSIHTPLMSWDAIIIVAKHFYQLPSLLVFASAMFIFTGFMNLAIFNRVLPPNFRFKHRWAFPLVAFLVLVVTFFVPIGIHGTEAVVHYVFLWSATADSLKMMYGFIERMLLIFLLVIINLSLTYTVVGWHIVLEFFKSLFPNNKVDSDEAKPPLKSYVIMAGMLVATFLLMFSINELTVVFLGAVFLIIRMCSEVTFTIWVYVLSKKKVRRYEKKANA